MYEYYVVGSGYGCTRFPEGQNAALITSEQRQNMHIYPDKLRRLAAYCRGQVVPTGELGTQTLPEKPVVVYRAFVTAACTLLQ